MAYLEIRNLCKKFNSDKKAVNDVNIDIEKGEIFGIIGLSGAGKSTLIRMINRLEEPSSGKISINGENILDFDIKQLRDYRKKTSMIFQSFNLLSSRTVFENVSLALEISHSDKKYIKEKVEELLKLVDLYQFKDEYINNLSGGQKQRVAIARALSTDPDILLSDESTSSLDPITSNSILELLKNINSKLGITIILITHQMEVIKKICDRVAVMRNGEIIESSTVKELFLNPKTKFTKELIADINLEAVKGSKNLLKILFDGNQIDIPYMSVLTRRFNIDINILGGTVEELSNGAKVGYLIVEFESNDREEVLEWLLNHKIKVEVIE